MSKKVITYRLEEELEKTLKEKALEDGFPTLASLNTFLATQYAKGNILIRQTSQFSLNKKTLKLALKSLVEENNPKKKSPSFNSMSDALNDLTSEDYD